MGDELAGDGAWIAAAREERGITQAKLVAAVRPHVQITQGWLSRVEAGVLRADGERLRAIASELGVTPDLLAGTRVPLVPLSDSAAYHRRRASATVGTLRSLHARLNLMRAGLSRLREVLGDRPAPLRDDSIEVGGAVSAADAARRLRELAGQPIGPLPSVTALAESIGVDVVRQSLPGRQVVAASVHPAGEAPLFLVNGAAPADRARFTLAHELGHVLCVNRSRLDDEAMADQFAAELLMPSRDVTRSLRAGTLDIPRLRELKQTWAVSAAALARRAADLSVIDDRHYRALNVEMSMLGWKTGEPDQIRAEVPATVPGLITRAVETLGVHGAADAVGVTAPRLAELFGVDVRTSSQEGSEQR